MTKDGTLISNPKYDLAESTSSSAQINPKNYKAHFQLGVLLNRVDFLTHLNAYIPVLI